MVGNKDYFDVLAENTQYLSDINTISFFDCIFDIAERMEKGQFIGTFIDDALSYKDMVKAEEKDELLHLMRKLKAITDDEYNRLKIADYMQS